MRITTLVVPLMFMAMAMAGCTDASDDLENGSPPEGDYLGVDAPVGTPPSGGGQVTNLPPLFNAVTLSSSTVDNSGGSTTVLTMDLHDPNGEQDFGEADLSIAVTGTITDSTFLALPKKNDFATSEPASFDAQGWKVWDSGASMDGVITVQKQYTVPAGAAPGITTFTPTIDPKGDQSWNLPVVGADADLTIDVFSEIDISGMPVFGNGTLDSTGNWGSWTATPGATQVPSVNFFHLENTGQDPDAAVIIDFTGTGFVGATEGAVISFADNMEFAWVELPAGSIPDDGVYSFSPANAEGSVTVQFSGLGNAIFVMYRIVEMPVPLPEDNYGASFTVTEL